MKNNKDQVLISGSVVLRKNGNKIEWFLVKTEDDKGWEFPKSLVRKGESSVRTSIRVMGEKASMTVKVLEEVGRAGGVATVGNKPVTQRIIYYLMVQKSASGEIIGFEEPLWLEYSKAARKIVSKREISFLKDANKLFKELEKARKKRKEAEDVDEDESFGEEDTHSEDE